MKQKKIPLRSCIITREKLPKKELIRVVKDNTEDVFIDLTGKSNGRGAYIKKDISVIKKAIASKRLDKHLDISISQSVYDQLEKLINEE